MKKRQAQKIISISAIIILIGLTILAIKHDNKNLSSLQDNDQLVPDLADIIENAKSLHTGRSNDLKLVKRNNSGGWEVDHFDDYPAGIAVMTELFKTLEQSRIISEKTSNPGLFEKFDLDDKKAARLIIKGNDKNQKPLLDLYIGKYSEDIDGTYVRHKDKKGSFIASGNIKVPLRAIDFLNRKLVSINPKQVRTFSINRYLPDRKIMTLSRNHISDEFELSVLPDIYKKTPAYEYHLGAVLSGISDISFKYVIEASRTKEEKYIQRITIETFEGIQVNIDMLDEGYLWSFITAHYIPEMSLYNMSEEEKEKTGLTDDFLLKNNFKKPKEAIEIVNNINNKYKGWAYQLSDNSRHLLTRDLVVRR